VKRVLILGATSAIAREMAAEFAWQGAALFLAARNSAELERVASDLRIRFGTRVEEGRFNAEDEASHPGLLKEVLDSLGGLDGVVYAAGCLGEQPRESEEVRTALKIVKVNLTAAVSLLAPLADFFEKQGGGFIMGLSSVAGDRARRSNYAYGAAKAGLSAYLDGLRHRLDGKGVKVFTLKLGPVDTPMTYGMRRGFLIASPARVGRRACRIAGGPSGIYYLPGFWRIIMFLIRNIPEPIFKRLNF